jgi:putative Mg2+ transporter-C (MgtC) family protein
MFAPAYVGRKRWAEPFHRFAGSSYENAKRASPANKTGYTGAPPHDVSITLEQMNLYEPIRGFHFSSLQQMLLASGVGERLLVACLLGGAIGVEREYHKKSLGLRTNLLICCGCAMFTFLSAIMAGDSSDKGRVASNIVQGIGFLGAGLIMRNRFRVSGLTNAATVFVVASIGMACGAGLYVPAALATSIVLVALTAIGMLETRFNIKMYSLVYEVRGDDSSAIEEAALKALDSQGKRFVDPERDAVAQIKRVSFSVLGTLSQHKRMIAALRASPVVGQLVTFHDAEDE